MQVIQNGNLKVNHAACLSQKPLPAQHCRAWSITAESAHVLWIGQGSSFKANAPSPNARPDCQSSLSVYGVASSWRKKTQNFHSLCTLKVLRPLSRCLKVSSISSLPKMCQSLYTAFSLGNHLDRGLLYLRKWRDVQNVLDTDLSGQTASLTQTLIDQKHPQVKTRSVCSSW